MRSPPVAASRAIRPSSWARSLPAGVSGARGTPGILVRLGKDVGLVAAERLGGVHRAIRVADERLEPECRPGPAGDADRDGDREGGVAFDLEGELLDERPQLFRQDRGLLDVGLGQDEHEFLAAVAADEVARPEVRLDRLGDASQDEVA